MLQQIEAAGIDKSIASRAVDQVFEDLDPDALLSASLEKRLHGRDRIADDREFQRLFRYLSAQGFESDKILAHLRKSSRDNGEDEGNGPTRRSGGTEMIL